MQGMNGPDHILINDTVVTIDHEAIENRQMRGGLGLKDLHEIFGEQNGGVLEHAFPCFCEFAFFVDQLFAEGLFQHGQFGIEQVFADRLLGNGFFGRRGAFGERKAPFLQFRHIDVYCTAFGLRLDQHGHSRHHII